MLMYSICYGSMQIFINNDLCVIKCYAKSKKVKKNHILRQNSCTLVISIATILYSQ